MHSISELHWSWRRQILALISRIGPTYDCSLKVRFCEIVGMGDITAKYLSSSSTSMQFWNRTECMHADRPHRLCPEIFRILFSLAWHTEWYLLLHNVTDDSMIPFAAKAAANAAATAAAKIANAYEWPRQPPKIAPSLGGSAHGFLGPPESFSKTAFR